MSVNFGGVLNGTQAFVERMVAQDSPAGVVITGSKQGEPFPTNCQISPRAHEQLFGAGITNPPGNPAYNASKAVRYSPSHLDDMFPPAKRTNPVLPCRLSNRSPSLSRTSSSRQRSRRTCSCPATPTRNSRRVEGPKPKSTRQRNRRQLGPRVKSPRSSSPDSTSSTSSVPTVSNRLPHSLCVSLKLTGWASKTPDDVKWELDQARMRYNLDDILLKRPALSRWNPEFAESYNQFVAKETGAK